MNGMHANWRVNKLLRHRGSGIKHLAELIGSSHAHVSQVMNNKPGRGGQTRRKLAALLTDRELALVGWGREGRLVPQDTNFQAETVALAKTDQP